MQANDSIKITPELRQRIAQMPEMPRTLALAIIAYGPASARSLAEACDQKASWVYNSANQLRGRLAPFGELVKDDTGYWIRAETRPEVIKPPAAVLPIVRKPAAELAKPEPAPIAPAVYEGKRRRIYLIPWGGYVELDSIIGLCIERDCVVVQQRGGGYLRSAPRPDAREVVDEITTAVAEMDNIEVVNKTAVKR